MNKNILNFLLISFLSIMEFSSFGQSGSPNIYKEVLEETNSFRKSNGLPALVSRSELNKLAQQHSDDMASGKVAFGHEGFKDRQQNIVSQIETLRYFAENVAFGPATGKLAVRGWENSPGHRRNLLGSFKYIGIGIARDKDGVLFYTQFFAG